jgi:hypothetical protein
MGIAIDFDGNAIFGTGAQNRFHIDVIARPPEQKPSGHVAQDGAEGIGDCFDDPGGLLAFLAAKTTMHAGHDKIEAGEDVLRVVEGAVGADVRFDPFEDAEGLSEFVIQRVDQLVLTEDRIGGKAARIVCRL